MTARPARGTVLSVTKTLSCSCGYLAQGETPKLLLADVEAHIATAHARSTAKDLTPTERTIADLAAGGLTNHEIAVKLGIGVKTVETHLSHVFRKLGVRSREELRRTLRPDGPLTGSAPSAIQQEGEASWG